MSNTTPFTVEVEDFDARTVGNHDCPPFRATAVQARNITFTGFDPREDVPGQALRQHAQLNVHAVASESLKARLYTHAADGDTCVTIAAKLVNGQRVEVKLWGVTPADLIIALAKMEG